MTNNDDFEFDFSDWGDMFEGEAYPFDKEDNTVDFDSEQSLVDKLFDKIEQSVPIIHMNYYEQDAGPEDADIMRANYVILGSNLKGNSAILDDCLYVYQSQKVYRVMYVVEARMWVVDNVDIKSLTDVLVKGIDPLYGFGSHSEG